MNIERLGDKVDKDRPVHRKPEAKQEYGGGEQPPVAVQSRKRRRRELGLGMRRLRVRRLRSHRRRVYLTFAPIFIFTGECKMHRLGMVYA